MVEPTVVTRRAENGGGGRPVGAADLDRLLAPRSVAVVGASERPASYGAQTVLNLRRAGFAGTLHCVNPHRESIFEAPCVPRLTDLPGPVDAVVVATPADVVRTVLEDAVATGAGGAIVYAAGLAEVGRAEEQAAALAPAAAGGLPVLGPNCNGLVAVPSRAPLWGDTVTVPDRPGPIALVTQSGNLGVVALAHRHGLGLHTVVSVGNAALVDVPFVIAALADRPGVAAVAVYAEADGDGAAWAEALARCADRGVRLAVLKAGRSAAGRAAGAGHTSAVAGDHRVFAALIEEAGGVLVTDPHALVETARALAAGRHDPRGVAVVTCSGGDAAIAADLSADLGVRLAAFAPDTVARLTALLPPGAAVGNPLDHTTAVWADDHAVAQITEAAAADPNVGHLLYVQDEPADLSPSDADEWASTREGGRQGAMAAGVAPLLAATCPGQEPSGAVSGLAPALAALAALQRSAPESRRLAAIAEVTRSHRTAPPAGPGPSGPPSGPLSEAAAKALLRASGVATPPGRTAESPQAAGEAAAALGFPVAIKVSVPGLEHKTDVGAVQLGLGDREAVVSAAGRLLALVDPRLGVTGRVLLVEAMVGDGVDLLVSARSDGVVPVLVLGAGGTWVEVIDDVAVVPLPASEERIRRALLGLRVGPLLAGARRRSPMALDAAVALTCRAADLLLGERLRLVEINPVRVTKDSAVALDALVLAGGPRTAAAPG